MDINQQLQLGRQQTVGMLWGMAGTTDGVQLPEEERVRVIATLRGLATLLESAPHNVVGLVLIAGEKIFGDQEGVNTSCVITGTAPSIAASHLVLEEPGRAALEEMIPHLLIEALRASGPSVGEAIPS